MKTSIPYKFAIAYNSFISITDRGFVKEKFLRIADAVGENKKVFELGCGTALLANYLKQGCSYIGWDLNENFVADCRKRGLNVFQKSIFDFDDYPDSDVIVISDVLHHIVPRDRELIRKARERTEKLIIAEPRMGLKNNLIGKKVPFSVYWLFDEFFGDNDGINPLRHRIKWKFANKEEIAEYLKEFNPKDLFFLDKNQEKFIAII